MQAVPRAEAPEILGRGRNGRAPPTGSRTPERSLPRGSPVQSAPSAKLHVDFPRDIPLAHDMDDAHHDERRDCIRRLFAVLTARLEDATTLAAKGQAKAIPGDTVVDLAAQVHEITTQAATIAEAIELLHKQA